MKGFGLTQDDFGQGYSSLYNLVSMPFAELKIVRAGAMAVLTTRGLEHLDERVLLCRRSRAKGFLLFGAVPLSY